MITRIEITEYLFEKSEVLLLECTELDYKFVLDIDRWVSDVEILEHIHAYYILGQKGGLARKGKYTPWGKMPITQDHSLESCKCAKCVRWRTYTRIERPDPKNPSIIAKEVIE